MKRVTALLVGLAASAAFGQATMTKGEMPVPSAASKQHQHAKKDMKKSKRKANASAPVRALQPARQRSAPLIGAPSNDNG